jgi:hypothetical protein
MTMQLRSPSPASAPALLKAEPTAESDASPLGNRMCWCGCRVVGYCDAADNLPSSKATSVPLATISSQHRERPRPDHRRSRCGSVRTAARATTTGEPKRQDHHRRRVHRGLTHSATFSGSSLARRAAKGTNFISAVCCTSVTTPIKLSYVFARAVYLFLYGISRAEFSLGNRYNVSKVAAAAALQQCCCYFR